MKIERFTPSCDWYRHVLLEHEAEGSCIKVADLVRWIRTHVREGNISTVYSDLLKALGEGEQK